MHSVLLVIFAIASTSPCTNGCLATSSYALKSHSAVKPDLICCASQPLVGEGQLGPTGVYVPSSSFKTAELKSLMAEQYEMPPEEVEKAIEFAESEEYVDIYCFTYCITGGPMEPTAFKVAGLQGMDKDAILQW